jgi:hypothetical protein
MIYCLSVSKQFTHPEHFAPSLQQCYTSATQSKQAEEGAV